MAHGLLSEGRHASQSNMSHSAGRGSVAATGPLHMHGPWTSSRIDLAWIGALLPALAAVFYAQGIVFVPVLATAIATALFWQAIFAWVRRSPFGLSGFVTAIAFIVMLPAAPPLWQIALSLSFGVVVGEQIFGGRGRNILNPSVVGLAFLLFSFPGTASAPTGSLIGVATLPGAIFLGLAGLISWRIVVAAFAGIALAGIAAGSDDPSALMGVGIFVAGLIFLGCDPVSASATNPGRLIYGFLIGVLATVFGVSQPAGIIFAVMLASIFAPLIDDAVIRLHALRRRRHHA